MENAVDFIRVSKYYQQFKALNDISFSVPKGSFFALLGVNGAGKSTLINAMSGLVIPTSGTIKLLGNHTILDYAKTRSKLGLVPQEIISDPFFTVNQLLSFQSGYFGKWNNQAWIDELLKRLHLYDKKHNSAHQLSGGMKRRLLIAMALVHKPEVIVLDEPTAGVDIELRKILWQFIQELHSEGKTIILTTHYLEEAEALCDQVAIIKKGELLKCSKMQDLIDQHKIRVLKITLENLENFDNKAENLPEVWQKRYRHNEGKNSNTMYFDLPNTASANSLFSWMQDRGLVISKMSLRSPPLEKIFVDLITDN